MAEPDAAPGRATDFIREAEEAGHAWRIGIAVGDDGLVRRLTIDPDTAVAAEIDGEAVHKLRALFMLLSARLPLASDPLDSLADEFAGLPEFALREAADIQRHEGAELRRAMRHLRERVGAADEAGT